MKAMILAAGRGERLRPRTDRIPKALIEVGGTPLLAWHLARLRRAGIREVVINVCHLADQITGHFGDGAAHGLAVRWSHEPQALETAGGIAQALALLGSASFLLVNADIWCDYDLSALCDLDLGERFAHLVLIPNPAHNTAGDFSLDGVRVGNNAAPRYTYAGIAVLSPALVSDVTPGDKAPLAPLLRSAAARGKVTGELHRGAWHDAGTEERLAKLQAALDERPT
jgi:MurNAc alpha-1-phosphate uridylyltransferase